MSAKGGGILYLSRLADDDEQVPSHSVQPYYLAAGESTVTMMKEGDCGKTASKKLCVYYFYIVDIVYF